MKIENETNIAAGVITLIIFLVLFSPEISLYLENIKPRYYLDSCETTGYDINVIEVQKRSTYIPDYDAEITIDPLRDKFNVNEYVEFKVHIKNIGILNFTKPYFYVEIFNPSGNMVKVSPCYLSSGIGIISIFKDLRCFGSDTKACDNRDKLKEWQGSTECRDNRFPFLAGNTCFTRDWILSGDGIVHKFKPDDAGTWKLFVILYDEEYFNRESKTITQSDSDRYKKAIAFGSAEIEVTRESEPDTNPYLLMKTVLLIILSTVSYFGLSRGFYIKLKNFYYKNKKEIVRLAIEAVLFTVLVFFIYKILI